MFPHWIFCKQHRRCLRGCSSFHSLATQNNVGRYIFLTLKYPAEHPHSPFHYVTLEWFLYSGNECTHEMHYCCYNVKIFRVNFFPLRNAGHSRSHWRTRARVTHNAAGAGRDYEEASPAFGRQTENRDGENQFPLEGDYRIAARFSLRPRRAVGGLHGTSSQQLMVSRQILDL